MRILAFILAIYITALSIVPCADGLLQCSADSEIELSIDDESHNHSDHQDDCTPICACACCGSSIVIPYFKTPVQKVVISTDYFFHYTFDYSFHYSEGVWHPPAVS